MDAGDQSCTGGFAANAGAPAALCGCHSPSVVRCKTTWEFWIAFHDKTAMTAATECCVDCGSARATNGDVGHALGDIVARLVAREAVGRTGAASALGLVAGSSLGHTVAAHLVHRTTRLERIDERLDLKTEEERCGMLRTAMGLPSNKFPRVEQTAVAELPRIILHEGLALKLGATNDSNHYRFARMTLRSVQQPFEVWRDVERGRPIIRFLNRYGAPIGGVPGIANHLVVMDAATGVAITQYVRRDAQLVSDRNGTLLAAGWAAPAA